MTDAEKSALYVEFRERFLSELSQRFLRENMAMSAIGRVLLKWKTELVMAQIIREMNATDSDASSDIPTVACCANERRNMNGGCDNCGAPCL